jgi:beta-glucosidase
MNINDTPVERANKLIEQMTLDEKVAMCHGDVLTGYIGGVKGNKRLGIPQLNLNDGPQGFRGPKATSTAFPSGLSIAASWDVETSYNWGAAMGTEFWNKGANV